MCNTVNHELLLNTYYACNPLSGVLNFAYTNINQIPMKPLAEGDIYRTDKQRRKSLLSTMLLSRPASFYPQLVAIFLWSRIRVGLGRYNQKAWQGASCQVIRACERVGMDMEFSGLDHLRKLDGPAVFTANHMSTLETLILPAIIGPLKPLSFVVKRSLIKYPLMGPILQSIDPVVVDRSNARNDLTTVLREGKERLGRGVSLMLFPQSTRSYGFDPDSFNTLGVKLAARAGVPVVPVAVKTDAWQNGRLIRDLGPIAPAKPVRIALGKPLGIEGKGAVEHKIVTEFIASRLNEWKSKERGEE